MKAFSDLKRLFLGIFSDVKEIHTFRFLPQVLPQISKSFSSRREFEFFGFFFSPQGMKLSAFAPVVAHSSRQEHSIFLTPRNFQMKAQSI